jgi:hypothetical protein
MQRTIIMSLFVVAVMAGCYSEESVGVGYSAGYAAPAPALVEVSPGVQVIADYDYPVFFSDGFYWRYDGGLWYRSGYWNGGWAVSYNVPVGVRRIDRPSAYAHYRAGGGWRGGGQAYRPAAGPAVRDHRAAAPARGPVVRDHRR